MGILLMNLNRDNSLIYYNKLYKLYLNIKIQKFKIKLTNHYSNIEYFCLIIH